MAIDHYVLTKIHICICIFVLVMFSTINGTTDGTSSLMTYSINNSLNYHRRDYYNMYILTRSVCLL